MLLFVFVMLFILFVFFMGNVMKKFILIVVVFVVLFILVFVVGIGMINFMGEIVVGVCGIDLNLVN